MCRAIQQRQERRAKRAKRDDFTPKPVATWKTRAHGHDAPLGPKPCHSTVLTWEEEALIVAFRRHTRLPLDACLSALQATRPHLTRSALHRGLPRPGIRRRPELAGEPPAKKRFKAYPIGSFHLDMAAVRPAEGKLFLVVALDRACKFADAELHAEANNIVAAQFLRHLSAAVPDKIHTVLTDNGLQVTNRKRAIDARHHLFDRVCQKHGIDHRLTRTNHPGTNGPVERMKRTLKEATVKTYHYQTHQRLKEHLQAFLMAYNFAKRLKTLRGLTPYEYICQCWQKEPERLTINPYHHTLGLNT